MNLGIEDETTFAADSLWMVEALVKRYPKFLCSLSKKHL